MPIRAYVTAIVGFIVGFAIAEWLIRGAPPSSVLTTLQTVCALTGGGSGLAAGAASKGGNTGKALIASAIGLAGCLLVGVAILLYRWLFL